MNPNLPISMLIEDYGSEASDILEDYGVGLDEWDLNLTLVEICEEYDIELEEIMERLKPLSDEDWDDDDDDEGDDEDETAGLDDDDDDDDDLDDDDDDLF